MAESASTNGIYVNRCIGKAIRILHVDNDAVFLAVAKRCLEESGIFEVETALSAEEALRKLRDAEYDVIIADYKMPGKNGLELLKEIRLNGNDIPFILFTCKGKEEIAIEALNSGVSRYVRKEGRAEATYAELKQNICEAVNVRRAEKLLQEAENRLRLITENIQEILLLADRDLTITYASTSVKWILGYVPEEITGKSITELIHPKDAPAVLKAIEKVFTDCSEENWNSAAKMPKETTC